MLATVWISLLGSGAGVWLGKRWCSLRRGCQGQAVACLGEWGSADRPHPHTPHQSGPCKATLPDPPNTPSFSPPGLCPGWAFCQEYPPAIHLAVAFLSRPSQHLPPAPSITHVPGSLQRPLPALGAPGNCSCLPGSSVQGILHVRILDWAAKPSSRGSS